VKSGLETSIWLVCLVSAAWSVAAAPLGEAETPPEQSSVAGIGPPSADDKTIELLLDATLRAESPAQPAASASVRAGMLPAARTAAPAESARSEPTFSLREALLREAAVAADIAPRQSHHAIDDSPRDTVGAPDLVGERVRGQKGSRRSARADIEPDGLGVRAVVRELRQNAWWLLPVGALLLVGAALFSPSGGSRGAPAPRKRSNARGRDHGLRRRA
jgi:hypothetical protein